LLHSIQKPLNTSKTLLTSKINLTKMQDIKTVVVSEKGQISIPKDVRSSMSINKGTKLVLIIKDNKITIQKTDELLKQVKL
jgi:AbrB family looped-hinge helix DNA binding protein